MMKIKNIPLQLSPKKLIPNKLKNNKKKTKNLTTEKIIKGNEKKILIIIPMINHPAKLTLLVFY